MPITLDGTNGITQAGEFNSDSSFGFKNRIINGAMVIDQRNAGAAITVSSTTAVFPVDRFSCLATDATGVYTEQQVSDAPVGFVNSIKATVTTVYSPTGSNQYNIRHNIEGYNVADLNWGSANAKTVTLSFWVKSSLTGTFGGSLSNSAFDRSYPFAYTISVANTWEQKSVTIAGDTTGTWLTTNGIGIRICLSIGMGSTLITTAGAWAAGAYLSSTGATNLIATSGATFYITGVQLEVGSTATSFDYRPYGTELALCQRYFERSYDIGTATATVTTAGANWTYINFASGSVNDFSTQLTFQASKRAIPTMTVYSPDTGASGNIGSVGGDKTATASYIGMHGCTIYGNLAGQSNAQCRAHWLASSEL